MAEDEGLAPPPPPQPKAPSISRDPGIQSGIVKDSLNQTDGHAFDLVDPIAKWRDRLSAAGGGGRLSGPSAPGGPDALQRITTVGEKLFGGTSLDAAKAAASFLMQPIRTITHDYQAAKMDRLQNEFLAAHAQTMADLNKSMGVVENRALRLTYLAQTANQIAGDSELAKRLVERKAALGNELAGQIDDALQSAGPEEIERLNKLKNDLGAWMKDRDARVAPERNEVAELMQRSENLAKALNAQHDAMAQVNDTAHYVKDGAHTRPQTIAFAAALRNLFVASRASIGNALTG